MVEIRYRPSGAVLREFMLDDSFARFIRGPVGSGKTSCCCVEVMRRAMAQEPSVIDGVRRSRWAIVRNTNPQLRTTTIKTWLEWFPEDVFGKFNWSPPYTHRIVKGDLDLEVIFLALDRPEDVRKLLSLELTGAFVNEARELPKSIIDAVTMRLRRYPSARHGGPSWTGLIADTNAPDEDHWWPIMAGEVPLPDHISEEEGRMLVKPEGWKFFNQPAGMIEMKGKDGVVTGYRINPKAENLEYIGEEYYKQIIQGKSKSWIDVYVMNRLGSVADGRPVYRDFSPAVHVAKEPLNYVDGVPIVVGMDFGLTPAAVFCQNVRNRWFVLHEVVTQDMGASGFARLLREEMAKKFPGQNFVFWGDPAGDHRAQTDEKTPFEILRGAGIMARPAPTNDPSARIDTVTSVLTRMVEGNPAFVVDPSCKVLIYGFQSGYQYRRLNVSGSERYDDVPDKRNKSSHVHDALQYALCGGGEYRKLLGRNEGSMKVVNVREPTNPLDRAAKRNPLERRGRVTRLSRL